MLHLIGRLRLVRSDGDEVRLRTVKGQGLLALLGVASGLRRSRVWLQDKLWSESEQSQGAGSLRQTVVRLRHALGPDEDCLLSEPGWIGLDPERVGVDFRLGPAAGGAEAPEFCEGLDIGDPEFEDWIRNQRLRWEERFEAAPPPQIPPQIPSRPLRREPPAPPRSVAPPSALPPVLLVAQPTVAGEDPAEFADLVTTEAAAQVAMLGGCSVVFEPQVRPPDPNAPTLRLRVRACRMGDAVAVQASLSDPGVGSLLWAQTRSIPLRGASSELMLSLHTLVAEIVAATTFSLGREAREAGVGGGAYRALRGALLFDGSALLECDRRLADAGQVKAMPVLDAWRAHVRVVSVVERVAADDQESAEEAIEMAGVALDADPLNPIVNAIAADVALHVENLPVKASHLARLAVARAPASPYARASLAQALARKGDLRQAHEEALVALRLSIGQPSQAWWYMRCCITAVRLKRYSEASAYAKAAHELAPTFRAPLRFLAALCYHLRDEQGAVVAFLALKALEPDFSLDLMASDQYRVATMRGTPLMDVTRSGLV